VQKLFQNYFSDNERVGKYSLTAISLRKKFEMILGIIPRPEIKLFQSDVEDA